MLDRMKFRCKVFRMAQPNTPQDVMFEAWRTYPLVREMRKLRAATAAMPEGDPDDVTIAARRAFAEHLRFQSSYPCNVLEHDDFLSAQCVEMVREIITEKLREFLQSAARSVAAHPRHWSSVEAKRNSLSPDHTFRWTPSSLLLPDEDAA